MSALVSIPRCEFRIAQSCENHGDADNEVGDNDSWPSLLICSHTGEYKDTSTDNGAWKHTVTSTVVHAHRNDAYQRQDQPNPMHLG